MTIALRKISVIPKTSLFGEGGMRGYGVSNEIMAGLLG
jgi:hypothetical protein